MRILLAFPLLAFPTAALAQTDAPQGATRAEVMERINVEFARSDTNKDGFLSRPEIKSAEDRALKSAAGKLEARLRQQFQELDKNKNGQLSPAEFSAMASVKPNPNAVALALQRADADKDGKISRNEFGALALRSFDAVDTNNDGKISPDEAKRPRGRK